TARTAFWCRRWVGGAGVALKGSSRKVTPTPPTPPIARSVAGTHRPALTIWANKASPTGMIRASSAPPPTPPPMNPAPPPPPGQPPHRRVKEPRLLVSRCIIHGQCAVCPPKAGQHLARVLRVEQIHGGRVVVLPQRHLQLVAEEARDRHPEVVADQDQRLHP